jgi:mannosidase alpha-like ER degradation enhancer 1
MINDVTGISLQYKAVNIHTGDVAYHTVDSLSAFWPGLQVLSGDLQNAIKAHQLCE